MNNKLTMALGASAVAALIGACGDGSANFRIGNFISRSGETCSEFTPEIVWGHGHFDLAGYDYYGANSQFDYEPAMEVFYEPRETGTGNENPDVFLDGVNVEVISRTDGLTLDSDLTKFSSRFRAAYSGDTFYVSPTLISAALGADINGQIGANESAELEIKVQAFGKEDGDDIVSPTVSYFVTVCRGCLTVNTGMCADFEEVEVCSPWNNQPMVCCDWQGPDGTTELCPGRVQEVPTLQ